MNNFLLEQAKAYRASMPAEHQPCMCNVTTCQKYNGDFLDYNCSDDTSIISGCPIYQKFNEIDGNQRTALIRATMVGRKEEDCQKNETVCPTCNGSTVGDFGQPFECELCNGSGFIPLFEVKDYKHRKPYKGDLCGL
jgi:hypothetical protein